MDIKSLTLYGHPFAECLTLGNNFRTPHDMRNDACLTYIQEGKQEIYSATQKIIASDKESVLMKCGNYIANFETQGPKDEFKSIVFHLDPISIKKAFGDRDLSFLKKKTVSQPIDPALKLGKNELLDSFVTSMMPYFDHPEMGTDEFLAVKLQELVLIISNGTHGAIANQMLGTLRSIEELKLEEIIAANLYNHLSIAELAHLCFKSESTFKRDFKKQFNTSPAKYIKTKKLEKAVKLLSGTKKSITDICWDCGFENAAHFSTSFSKVYSKSPKEYRGELN